MNIKNKSNEIIVGRNPVLAAILSNTQIEKIFILRGSQGKQIQKIKSLAKQNGIICVEIDKRKFREFLNHTSSQGVIAVIRQKRYVEVQDIIKIAKNKNENPFIIILDEIKDPHNLGAIIRTAECAGVHGVIIPRHHSVSITTTVAKTSSGASQYLSVAKVTNIANTIDILKEHGIWIVGATTEADKIYTEIDYNIPIALIIGSEGYGIRRLIKEKCDFLVKIPLYGKIESLNASVSAALIIYEIVRKRNVF